MQFLLLLLPFIIFLYCFYRFVKDDYVFIRRNMSPEQTFDIMFTSVWVSLFFARFIHFLFHPITSGNYFLLFLSPRVEGLSLTGAVIGGIVALYLIGKYKKVPLGRLADFVTLAFIIALPVGFLSYAFIYKPQEMVIHLLSAIIYTCFMVYVVKFFYPKIMSRTLREGSLTIYFLEFFAVTSIALSAVPLGKKTITIFSAENISLAVLLLFSLFLLFKLERGKSRKFTA